MATGAAPPRTVERPGDARLQERQIDEKLHKTQSYIKRLDAIGGLLGAVVLAGCLIVPAVLIDHWIFGLGQAGRWLFWLALVFGTLGYAAWQLLPLLIYRINPIFVARALERSTPSFKNSLINYLFFRRHHAGIHESIYRGLEDEAGHALTPVEIESAIDRSWLIRLGIAAAAIVVVLGVYKIASPKDPFQTIARIILPWDKIDRPSRVRIADVRPGDATVYWGRPLEISAEIRGLDDDRGARILWTADDQSLKDFVVPMAPDEYGLRHQGVLSPQGLGVRKNGTYVIVAGDARSGPYYVQRREQPRIAVRSLGFDYPDYTGRPDEATDQDGHIEAPEGTRVTIQAVANVPLQGAWIRLDTPEEDTASPAARKKRIAMKLGKENTASGTLTLRMQPDGLTGAYTGYQLEFLPAEETQRLLDPIRYRIEIQPDLRPEIEVLYPKRTEVDLPEDGELSIRLRVLDPDYGLVRLCLNANHFADGKPVFRETLFEAPVDRAVPGQIYRTYSLRPRDLNLSQGDTINFWAEAVDNCALDRGPNHTETKKYRVRIVVPEQMPPSAEQQNPSSGDQADTDTPADRNDEQSRDEHPRQPQDDTQQPTPADPNQPPPTESDPADMPPDQPDDQADPDAESQDKENPSENPNENQAEGSQTEQNDSAGADQNPEQKQQPDDSQQNDSGQEDSQQAEPQQENSQQQDSGQENSQQQGSSGQSGNQGSQGTEGSQGNEGTQGDQTGGTGQGNSQGTSGSGQQDNQGGSQNTTGPGSSNQGADSSSGDSGQAGADQSPVASDGTQDGDAFERIQEYLKEKGQDESTGSQPADQEKTESGTGDSPEQGNADQGTSQAPNGEQTTDAPRPADPNAPAEGTPTEGNPKPQEGTSPPSQGPAENSSDNPGDGSSGMGKPSEQPGGTPEGQNDNLDSSNPKHAETENQEPTPEGPTSTTVSKRQSDSQGEQGDRSGGGEEGGGQNAQQQGTGGPGSHTPDDSGSGQAEEQGPGSAVQPGQQGTRPSETPTGQSGDQPGQGSHSRPDQRGEGSPTGRPPQNDSSQQASDGSNTGSEGNGSEAPRNFDPRRSDQQAPGSMPIGGGQSGTTATADNPQGAAPPADDYNEQFTRKATDLVLERLEDQETLRDQELLDRLGWTPEELKQFAERWRRLKNQASEAAPDDEKARELDEAMRSLGLRPGRDRSRQVQGPTDAMKGIYDAGDRSQPPSEYMRQYRAFMKGSRENRQP